MRILPGAKDGNTHYDAGAKGETKRDQLHFDHGTDEK